MRIFSINLHSLKARFLLIEFGLFVLIFFAVGYLALSIESARIQFRSNESVKAFVELSSKPLVEDYELYFNSGYYKFVEVFNQTWQLNNYVKRIQILSVDGKVVFDSKYMSTAQYMDPGNIEKISDDSITKPDPTYRYSNDRNPKLTEVINPYFTDWKSHPYTIRYIADYYSTEQETLNLIFITVLAMFFLTFVSAFLLSLVTNRSLINPLKEVIKTAKLISRGEYGKHAKTNSKDEIGDLANSVNKMARKLEQDIIDLRELDKLKDEFIDVAAHNFKAPLNHLKFDIAYLIQHVGKKVSEKEFELLQDINISGKKLQLLSEDLIGIQALQNKETGNVFVPVDLSQLLEDVLGELKHSADVKNVKFKAQLDKKAIVLGEYQKLKQLFLNLIDNAIQYSDKKESTVSVRIKESNNSYIIEIEDQGVGMLPEEIKKLFQKFYRAPSSEIYNKEGAGLGLYLAKLIVNVHHGNIWVESEKDKGSHFYVSFLKK